MRYRIVILDFSPAQQRLHRAAPSLCQALLLQSSPVEGDLGLIVVEWVSEIMLVKRGVGASWGDLRFVTRQDRDRMRRNRYWPAVRGGR